MTTWLWFYRNWHRYLKLRNKCSCVTIFYHSHVDIFEPHQNMLVSYAWEADNNVGLLTVMYFGLTKPCCVFTGHYMVKY